MLKLRNKEWVKKDFNEIVLHNKTCLFKSIGKEEVLLMKVRRGNIQIGKLINFFNPDRKLKSLEIDLGKLDFQKNVDERFGIEPGFFYKIIPFNSVFDWKSEYKKLLNIERNFIQVAANKEVDWFSPIQITEYQRIVVKGIKPKNF